MKSKKDKIAEEADYIEVKNSDLIRSFNWKKLFYYLTLIILTIVIVTFYLFPNFFQINKKDFSEFIQSTKNNELSKVEEKSSDDESKVVNKNEKAIDNQIILKQSKLIEDGVIIENLNNKIDNISDENNNLKDELSLLKEELINIKKINNQLISKDFPNAKILLLLNFSETLNLDKINGLSNQVLEFFPRNEDILNLLNYFKNLNNSQILHKSEIVGIINQIINDGFFFNEKRYQMLNKDENGKGTVFENFFINLLNSNFRIRKVGENENLYTYADKNADGKFDYIESLVKIKDYLIIDDQKQLLLTINEIKSPISNELENIISSIKTKIQAERNYEKFRTILLNEVMKEISFD